VLRVTFRRLTVEIDAVPAGIAAFLILIGIGVMNHLSQRRLSLPPGPVTGVADQPAVERPSANVGIAAD
jgi:hypothetical protein